MGFEEKQAYRDFCKQCNELPVFFQDWYLDVVCHEGEWDVLLAKRNEEIVGVFTYFLKKKGPFRYITMPLLSRYMGPFIPSKWRTRNQAHKILEELRAQIPKVDDYAQNFHYSVDNWLPFYWNGYRQTTYYSYLIQSMKNEEEVFSRITKRYRSVLKKASAKYTIGYNLPLEEFYEIIQMSQKRWGQPNLITYGFLEAFDTVLKKHNARKIFYLLDDKNRIVAVKYLIWDMLSGYALFSGDHTDFRQPDSSIFLTWEEIKYTINDLKLETFDFAGSMLRKVEPSRRYFGGEQTPYFFVSKNNSRLLKLVRKINS